MSKPNNFGGIPTATYSKILGFLDPPATGVPAAEAAKALGQLVRERHAALVPGDGRTGFMEAYKAFEELDSAITAVQAAAGATTVERLGDAIKVIAHLWAKGPVADDFFSQ
jgi:hypothetical protein